MDRFTNHLKLIYTKINYKYGYMLYQLGWPTPNSWTKRRRRKRQINYINKLLEQHGKHEYNRALGFDVAQSGMDTSF